MAHGLRRPIMSGSGNIIVEGRAVRTAVRIQSYKALAASPHCPVELMSFVAAQQASMRAR
jgi:hypothetical protein